MKSKTTLLLTLILLLICNFGFSQNVSTRFTAIDIDDVPQKLDSISLYNITNNSSKTIFPLPAAWRQTYGIDFSTGQVYGIETHLANNNEVSMLSNTPGKLIFSANSQAYDKIFVEVFSVMGKLHYSYKSEMMPGINTYELNIDKSQLYIVKITTPSGGNTFKVLGNNTVLSMSLNHIEVIANSSMTKSEELNSYIKDDWTFTEGDWVRITAHLSGYNSDYYETIPINGADDTIYITVPCPGEPYVVDYDGNVYGTVLIGKACWMRENLRTTHYADGTPITEDKMAFYEHNEEYGEIYGRMYRRDAITGSETPSPQFIQGICPNGWTSPNWTNWQWDLVVGAGLPAIFFSEFNLNEAPVADLFRSKGTLYWYDNPTNTTNRTGMYFLPSGGALYDEDTGWSFWGINNQAQICTNDGYLIIIRPSEILDTNRAYLNSNKIAGCVRCMKKLTK